MIAMHEGFIRDKYDQAKESAMSVGNHITNNARTFIPYGMRAVSKTAGAIKGAFTNPAARKSMVQSASGIASGAAKFGRGLASAGKFLGNTLVGRG